MVAYSFQRMFVDAIEEGRKPHTLRNVGKRRHARPGETIQMYTAMRTKQCRKLGEATCIAVLPIRLQFARAPLVAIEGRPRLTSDRALNGFAYRDGFEDWFALAAFWGRVHKVFREWEGVIIEWDAFRPQVFLAKAPIPK